MGYVISAVVLIIILFVMLLFLIAAKVHLSFLTEGGRLNADVTWLGPLAAAAVSADGSSPELVVRLLGLKVYKKTLEYEGKQQQGNTGAGGLELFKSLHLDNIQVRTVYGSADPFYTGMASGLIGPLLQYFQLESFEQVPDFLAEEGYLDLKADAELNLGLTIVNLFKTYKTRKSGKLTLQNR